MTTIFDATRLGVKNRKSSRPFGADILTNRKGRTATQSVPTAPATETPTTETPATETLAASTVPTLHYGLSQSQYHAVCATVNSERLALYAEYTARYGPGEYPTVGEVQERCETTRERLIEQFKAMNENRPVSRGSWPVEVDEDEIEDQPMTDQEIEDLFAAAVDRDYERWGHEVVDGFTGHPATEV